MRDTRIWYQAVWKVGYIQDTKATALQTEPFPRHMFRYRVNVALVTDHRRRAARYPGGCPLSEDKVDEYKQMLVLYEDFRQASARNFHRR